MALNERMAIGMPPDGIGKHFNIDYAIEINYQESTTTFAVNQTIVGGSSGLEGHIVRVNQLGPTIGDLFVILEPEDLGRNFTAGEDILILGTPYAKVANATNVLHTQRAQIVGGNNPFNSQFVDRQGAAAVRYAEGSTIFDGFGGMVVSNALALADYQSPYGLEEKMWHAEAVGTGEVVYQAGPAGFTLRTGLANGDKATLVSHRYHPYQAGSGQLILVTGFSGDAGKAGVVRRWGYFDDEDGLFFQLNGTQLSFVVRSSTSGTPVDTVIPRVLWNTDKFDGDGVSQFNIDVSKHNLYWIDFAWLGTGAVRFGVYGPDGARLTAHTIENGNKNTAPYMRTPRLPVRFEIENTSVQGSSSEYFAGCAAVKTEGQANNFKIPLGSATVPTKTVTGAGFKSIGAVRPALTFNGYTNRKICVPVSVDIHAFLNGTNTPARVKFALTRDPQGLTGQIWGPVTDNASSIEFDGSATGTATGGETLAAALVYGERILDLSKQFSIGSAEEFSLHSDNVQNEYYLLVEPVNPTDNVDVTIAFNWYEV